MRVTVTPVPGARIWDPAHNRFLAQEGAEVDFDHHWARHERQGNVTITATESETVTVPIGADGAPETGKKTRA